MDDQRFDGIVRELAARSASRRIIIKGLAATLAAGAPALGGLSTDAKGRNKKKGGKMGGRKKGGGSNGGGKGELPAEACDTYFASDEDRAYCRFIRRQCDGADPRAFCIVEGDPADPAMVAVCCNEAAECCSHQCCGSPQDPQLKCCSGECVNTDTDINNCGACGKRCENGQVCRGGSCGCEDSACEPACPPEFPVRCDSGCYGPGFSCCPDRSGACEPDTVCFNHGGGWGCCPSNQSC
jgi:hypothetical protein